MLSFLHNLRLYPPETWIFSLSPLLSRRLVLLLRCSLLVRVSPRTNQINGIASMSGRNSNCTVYIGNVDERVSDRVLYDIMIQAGRVVDLHVPRDKETDKPKGYAFAEYETEEIAEYAVKLFSGLVTLCNRPLKFAISGQDKLQSNSQSAANSGHRTRPHSLALEHTDMGMAHHSERFSTPQLFSPPPLSNPPVDCSQEPPPPGVSPRSDGYGSHPNGVSFDYSRRVLGSTFDSISRSRPRRY